MSEKKRPEDAKVESTPESDTDKTDNISEQGLHRKPRTKRRFGKIIYISLLCLLSSVMLFSLYKVISISMQYRAGDEEYDEIINEAVIEYETYVIPVKQRPAETPMPEVTTPPPAEDTLLEGDDTGIVDEVTEAESEEPAPTPAPALKESVIVVPKIDTDTLKEKNGDFTGWIYLHDTVMNYPVVQGEDNEYYLDHTFYDQKNINGCIFIDSRLDLTQDNKNLIFYGHHMNSGAMFAILRRYVWYDFYYSHKYIIYVTEEGPYLITVFSAYNAPVVSDAWRTEFANDEEYAVWLRNIKAASEVRTDFAPTVEDNIVTLTTCSFSKKDARIVVHGVIEPLF